MIRSSIFRRIILIVGVFLVLYGCQNSTDDDAEPILSKITSFSLSDGVNIYEPFEMKGGNIFIIAPTGDFSHMKATFTHDGEKVLANSQEQVSGVTEVDFSSSTEPVRYSVVSKSGHSHNYNVYLFDLPVVFIETPNNVEIKSKDDWIEGASIKIINTDGSINLNASTAIKGRGNTTWGYPKKPYTIKLDSKSEILGMPSGKRWDLLANWADRTLMRNTIAFAISNKTKALEWTPRGRHVEVFLNGKFLGNYFFCEHIKVAKQRLNITKMNTETDVEGDALTGGYLLEIDSHYDEIFKFRTKYRGLPVNLKYPDENVKNVQFEYIKEYINNLEELFQDEQRILSREYTQYLDVDTFIDFFLVHELAEYSGPSDNAYSSHVYKDRMGKLKAGPVWDFDRTTFKPDVNDFMNRHNALWYGYLFKDPIYFARLKEKWNESKLDFEEVLPQIDSVKRLIRRSANCTLKMWPTTCKDNGDESLSFDDAADRLKKAYSDRIDVLDGLINNL